MIDIATKLPWKIGVALAVITLFGFHYMTALPLTPAATANAKNFSDAATRT